MRFYVFISLAIIIAFFTISSDATPASALAVYRSMQSACDKAVEACYAAGCSKWAVKLGLTAPTTDAACKASFDACQASAKTALGLVLAIPFI
jgi:ABC-type sulfate transport system permease component